VPICDRRRCDVTLPTFLELLRVEKLALIDDCAFRVRLALRGGEERRMALW
jgi:hypothetical protein